MTALGLTPSYLLMYFVLAKVKVFMESNRVMGFIGSPRRMGNTELIVDQILLGAKDKGMTTEKTILSKLKIGPCIACDNCEVKGNCFQDDDMPQLLKKMDKNEVWILGTPVYWWGPTAQMKTFIDRWYGGRHVINFEGHKVILVIPFEDTDMRTGKYTEGMLKRTVSFLKMDVLHSLLVPGVLHPGDVNGKDSILEDAYKIGYNLT